MSLEDTLANMSLYDAKKYFRKAQNVVFNYTEMEAKVREATNNEPWGASTTLMEQISQGTYNMREREEVLGMIFRRLTEKRANEWRQIYKALQLLDYLIRHGSERFIDDTRSSISLIKMLESFHYIDSQGRDQGINVRNRAKALAELLSDDETIRSERKKARETAKKYKGVAGGSAGVNRQANPRAGFNSTRVHGISVSAESDESEDETPEFGRFSENTVSEPSGSGSGTIFGQTTSAKASAIDEEEDNDDDDEFTDFQSAAPSASTAATAHTNNYPIRVEASIVPAPMPEILPAIATETKKSDPFSNLFSSAKKSSETIQPISSKPAQTPKTQPKPVEDQDGDDEDDLFGEMTGAGASQQPQGNQTTKADDVDLLSF